MPRQYDDRLPHSGGRRIPVDPREPGFDARSILVQGLVDRNRAHKEGPNRDFPTSSRARVLGPECFSRAIRAAVIPPNFRLATGVSKFTGESKPATWIEDYRVAVQIGGANDDMAMKHLPLILFLLLPLFLELSFCAIRPTPAAKKKREGVTTPPLVRRGSDGARASPARSSS